MSKRPQHAPGELSVTEFLTLARLGFYPHGLVVGSSLYEAGTQYDWTVSTAEVRPLSDAMRQARGLAMQRMREQASRLHAEGVVDVRLELEHHLWRGARQVVKFVVMGTAIGFDSSRAPEVFAHAPSLRLANGHPFTSDLTATDFVALLRAGYRPVTHGDVLLRLRPRPARTAPVPGQDAEVTSLTQAFFQSQSCTLVRLAVPEPDTSRHLPLFGFVKVRFVGRVALDARTAGPRSRCSRRARPWCRWRCRRRRGRRTCRSGFAGASRGRRRRSETR